MHACLYVCVAMFLLDMHPKCIYDGFRYGMSASNNMPNNKIINHK